MTKCPPWLYPRIKLTGEFEGVRHYISIDMVVKYLEACSNNKKNVRVRERPRPGYTNEMVYNPPTPVFLVDRYGTGVAENPTIVTSIKLFDEKKENIEKIGVIPTAYGEYKISKKANSILEKMLIEKFNEISEDNVTVYLHWEVDFLRYSDIYIESKDEATTEQLKNIKLMYDALKAVVDVN